MSYFKRCDVAALLAELYRKKCRRAGLKPIGFEAASSEQQEDVEGVIDLLIAPPVIAVVPVADLVSFKVSRKRLLPKRRGRDKK